MTDAKVDGDRMQPIEVLRIIQQAVQDVKKKNQEVISTDALLKWIDGLTGYIENANEDTKRRMDTNLAVFRAEHERNIALYKAQETRALELFSSVVTYGSAAMKVPCSLTVVQRQPSWRLSGNIWAKETGPEAVKSLTLATLMFSMGVLAAALGTAASYFCQYCYSEPFPRAAVVFHARTVLLVLISFGLFGYGAYETYSAFAKHLG